MVKKNPKSENHAKIDFRDEYSVYKGLNAVDDDKKYHELTYTADEYLIHKTHELWNGKNFKISVDKSARKYFVEPIEPTTGETKIIYSYTENLFFDRHDRPVLIPPSEAKLSRKRFISNFQKEWNQHAEAEESIGLNLAERKSLHLLQMEYIIRARVDPDKIVIAVNINRNLTLFQTYVIWFTENICKTPDNNIVLLPKKISKKKKQQLLLDIDQDCKGKKRWMNIFLNFGGESTRSFPCAEGRRFFMNYRQNDQSGAVGLDPWHNERLLFQHYPGFAEKLFQESEKIESKDQLCTEKNHENL